MANWSFITINPAAPIMEDRGILALIRNVVGAPSMPTHCFLAIVFTDPAWSISEYAGFSGVRLSMYWVKLNCWVWACTAVTDAAKRTIDTTRNRTCMLIYLCVNFTLLFFIVIWLVFQYEEAGF